MSSIDCVNDAVKHITNLDRADDSYHENLSSIVAETAHKLAALLAIGSIGLEWYSAAHRELMKAAGWGD